MRMERLRETTKNLSSQSPGQVSNLAPPKSEERLYSFHCGDIRWVSVKWPLNEIKLSQNESGLAKFSLTLTLQILIEMSSVTVGRNNTRTVGQILIN
jgi:hypothetical protein